MEELSATIEVDVTVLTFFSASLVPLAVALLTKLNASSPVKAVLNLVLAVLVACASYLIAHDGASDVWQLLTVAIEAYLTTGVTYTNLWKPTTVAPKLQVATAGFGLGKAA